LKNASEVEGRFRGDRDPSLTIGHQDSSSNTGSMNPGTRSDNSETVAQNAGFDYRRSPPHRTINPQETPTTKAIADGTGAIGQDRACIRIQSIRDGNRHTLLLIETKTSVPWTKPQNLDELPRFR